MLPSPFQQLRLVFWSFFTSVNFGLCHSYMLIEFKSINTTSIYEGHFKSLGRREATAFLADSCKHNPAYLI